ncbi:MAG: hypothetical protein V3V74_07125 [Nitrosomonadaceae bacterium]
MKTVVAIMALVVLSVVAVTVFGVEKRQVEMGTVPEAVVPFSEAEFNDAHQNDIRGCPTCGNRWQGLLCLDGDNTGSCPGCQILSSSARLLFEATNAAAIEELRDKE